MSNLVQSATLSLMILIFSKFLGIVRDVSLAYRFGTSYIVDAYTICIGVPSILFSIFASGFCSSYIPTFSRVAKYRKSWFFCNVMSILFVFSIVITIMCFVFSDYLVSLMAPGLNERTFEQTVLFVRIVVFMLPFMLVFNVLAAHSQAHENFVFLNVCNSIVVTLVIICSVFVASNQFPEPLVMGYVFAEIIATVLLWLYLKHCNILRYSYVFKLRDRDFGVLCKVAIPFGVSLLVNQLNIVVDKFFASTLGEGVISALSYADKMQLLCYSFTVSVFISVCFPRISNAFADGNKAVAMDYVKRALGVAVYVSLPMMLLFIGFANQIVRFIFERGEFSSYSTDLTSACLTAYSGGIIFYSLREIASRVLMANMKQNLILKNTIISVVINIILNCWMIDKLGGMGIALATSISGCIAFLLIVWDLKKNGICLLNSKQIREYGMIVLCGAIAAGTCYLICLASESSLGRAAIMLGIAMAFIVYLGLSIVCRIDIFVWMYERLPKSVRVIPWLNNID